MQNSLRFASVTTPRCFSFLQRSAVQAIVATRCFCSQTLLADRNTFEEWLKPKGALTDEMLYSLKWKEIKSNPLLTCICRKHNNSHIKAILELFPEHNLLPWKFSSIPKYYWDSMTNQKRFFDWFASQNNIVHPEQWKPINRTQVYAAGGAWLVKKIYKSSLPAALRALYPTVDWDSVYRRPNLYWEKIENISKFLDSIRASLHIEDNDWSKITSLEGRI